MGYYVYYEDDYPDNGGIGLVGFSSLEDACGFIEERLRNHRGDLKDYTLIQGNIVNIKAVSVVTKVQVA